MSDYQLPPEVLAWARAEMASREFCICAAIQLPDGYVVNGHRHDDCYNVIRKRPDAEQWRDDLCKAKQGFMTSSGRFVDREEGMRLQKYAGKKSSFSLNGELCGRDLFSEDLYPNPQLRGLTTP
jgi:hypothetical protein